MDPPAKAPRVAPGAPAEPPPPALWLNARCSPADASAPCWFVVLPEVVLFLVFAALPADARAGCASVCRAWAHILLRGADAWRFWTRLDLSGGSGVTCTKSDAALAGAAALARGRLQELNLSKRGERPQNRDGITLGAVLGVLRGSPELRELALDGVDGGGGLDSDALHELLTAAPPTLRRLDAESVSCGSSASSLPLLRAEPPFGPLRVDWLAIRCRIESPDEILESVGTTAGATSLAAALAHACVGELCLQTVLWFEPDALEALADALLAPTCRVGKLIAWAGAGLSPAYLPALARLLAGRDGAALSKVTVYRCPSLFEGASPEEVEAVCAALRRSTLTHVQLLEVGLTEQGEDALSQAAAATPRLHLEIV